MGTFAIYLISIAVFAALYAIKGGSGWFFFSNWKYVRSKNKFYDRLLDGKVISTILAFLFIAAFTANLTDLRTAQDMAVYNILLWPSLIFAAGWLLSVAPSMGEEHGAIGTTVRSWGPYVEWMPEEKSLKLFGRTLWTYPEGRMYGIKKGIQRGIWIGAIMAAFTGYLPYIFWSLAFVPAVFVGQEIYWRVFKKNSWALSEPIIGALCYGIPTAGYILSL